MNLAAIRPSFNELSEAQQLEHILQIRMNRRHTEMTKKTRAVKAASKPRAAKHEKKAINVMDTITPEQAAALLAMLGEIDG